MKRDIDSIYVKDIDNEDVISIEELFYYLTGYYPAFLYTLDCYIYEEMKSIYEEMKSIYRINTTRLLTPQKYPYYPKDYNSMYKGEISFVLKYTEKDLHILIPICEEFIKNQKITFFDGLEGDLLNLLNYTFNKNVTSIIVKSLKSFNVENFHQNIDRCYCKKFYSFVQDKN